MKKSEIIQQVLDRTINDIALLKEEVITNSDDILLKCFYLYGTMEQYPLFLKQLLEIYKAAEDNVCV